LMLISHSEDLQDRTVMVSRIKRDRRVRHVANSLILSAAWAEIH